MSEVIISDVKFPRDFANLNQKLLKSVLFSLFKIEIRERFLRHSVYTLADQLSIMSRVDNLTYTHLTLAQLRRPHSTIMVTQQETNQ